MTWCCVLGSVGNAALGEGVVGGGYGAGVIGVAEGVRAGLAIGGRTGGLLLAGGEWNGDAAAESVAARVIGGEVGQPGVAERHDGTKDGFRAGVPHVVVSGRVIADEEPIALVSRGEVGDVAGIAGALDLLRAEERSGGAVVEDVGEDAERVVICD